MLFLQQRDCILPGRHLACNQTRFSSFTLCKGGKSSNNSPSGLLISLKARLSFCCQYLHDYSLLTLPLNYKSALAGDDYDGFSSWLLQVGASSCVSGVESQWKIQLTLQFPHSQMTAAKTGRSLFLTKIKMWMQGEDSVAAGKA